MYSVYRDFHQALDHLNKRLIATYAPETMRGGGLLVKAHSLISSCLVFLFSVIEILLSLSTELQSPRRDRNVSYATIYVFEIFH